MRLAATLMAIALLTVPAGAIRHGAALTVHHGHPINAWGGSHHPKLR